jgi:hypothetical protein
MMHTPVLACLLTVGVAAAQSLDQFKFDRLAAKAKEHTEITLDAATLQMAARDMTGPADAKIKSLVANLKGLAIRSYEFASNDAYSPADLDRMRALFPPPAWKRVMQISSKADRETFELFSRIESGKPVAMAMLTAEPRELTLVYIDGAVDIGRISELGDRFGFPSPTKKGSK